MQINQNEENLKIKTKVDSDFPDFFDLKYKNIISPVDGFIKKKYLEYYLKNEAILEKQKGILVKIMPDKTILTEEQAGDCGKIINIEFNGNAILACEVNDVEPNYIFWIYIKNMDEKNGEIFVINAVERLMNYTKLKFNFIIKTIGN